VQVAMLGPLEVRTDGDPGEFVEVAGARLRALLIMLALYVNRSRDITGWTLKSITSVGLCLICTSVRQASENVWSCRYRAAPS